MHLFIYLSLNFAPTLSCPWGIFGKWGRPSVAQSWWHRWRRHSDFGIELFFWSTEIFSQSPNYYPFQQMQHSKVGHWYWKVGFLHSKVGLSYWKVGHSHCKVRHSYWKVIHSYSNSHIKMLDIHIEKSGHICIKVKDLWILKNIYNLTAKLRTILFN